MYISIGVDCGMAEFLRRKGLRTVSFPFDWLVSYHGVSECIEDQFSRFVYLKDRINPYHMYFAHDFQETPLEDTEKYVRRCQRFLDALEGEVVFCRKGHASHHHQEHPSIRSDLEDAEQLDRYLAKEYPALRYKIIVILVCGPCFGTHPYPSSERIDVHNIATPTADTEKFERLCDTLFT